jgi:outer membrane protein assembly factor BamE (lipoprotein component of BamABCDE complex)
MFLVTFGLSACTSMPKLLDKLQPGMDKDQVLAAVGSPKRTFRDNGLDHWTYIFHENDQEWRRDVIFENGHVIRVTKATASKKLSWVRELEETKSMEEFESKARSLQNRAKGDFKPVDGGKPTVASGNP